MSTNDTFTFTEAERGSLTEWLIVSPGVVGLIFLHLVDDLAMSGWWTRETVDIPCTPAQNKYLSVVWPDAEQQIGAVAIAILQVLGDQQEGRITSTEAKDAVTDLLLIMLAAPGNVLAKILGVYMSGYRPDLAPEDVFAMLDRDCQAITYFCIEHAEAIDCAAPYQLSIFSPELMRARSGDWANSRHIRGWLPRQLKLAGEKYRLKASVARQQGTDSSGDGDLEPSFESGFAPG